MVWWQVIGWVGSALVVFSLTQARVLRFRWLNLAGAVLATAYNAVFAIWPFVVMNGAIAVIDVYWLVRLVGERHDEAVYEVVELARDDAYLEHILKVHAVDVALHFAPIPAPADAKRLAFLVARRDETVGAVIVADVGDGVGQVELDWVTPRFRDFTPGEFVYRRSGVFAAHGFHRLVTHDVRGQEEYLARVGFTREGDHLVREVAA
ncbi:MAG TPA: hypothetical protein VGC04_11865 [Cellulomonas sp.]